MDTPIPIVSLRKRADFLRLADKGRRWVAPGFILQYQRRETGEREIRVGFTVTKKQGNAVVRNRIKRRLRETVRLVLPGLADHPADYVLIGREAAKDCPFTNLQTDLTHAILAVHQGKGTIGPYKPGPRKTPTAKMDTR